MHQIALGVTVCADPIVVRILHFFSRWREVDELVADWPASGRKSLRAAIDQLTALSFLQRQDRKPPDADLALRSWNGWNPAASLFHFLTKDVSWATGKARDTAEAAFRRKAGGDSDPPAPTKRYPGVPRFTLPSRPAKGEFARVLLGRRTWRTFGSRAVTLEALAQLLDLTFGVQFWGEAGKNDRVPFKTSPSGGARHPIEAYLLVLRVEGLPRGLYHYDADGKELELIGPGGSARQVDRYLVGQWFYRRAAVLVLMTAVVARKQWRYSNPRAYRSILFEAGHLCQTFCLVATWLGLAPFCTAALADSRIEQDLGVDGVNEILLYAAGVGTRPADGHWDQWPEHLPGHPCLPPAPRMRMCGRLARRRR